MKSIYFDAASTVAMRPEAIFAYCDVAGQFFANPSSSHLLGSQAKAVLEGARESVAAILGASPSQIIFNSGATESANTFVASIPKDTIAIVSPIEHHCVLDPAVRSNSLLMNVNRDGKVDLVHLKEIFKERRNGIGMVFLMAVNNETGVIQPIDYVASLIKKYSPSAKLIVDAVQGANWLELKGLLHLVDGAFLAAHKFGGPKGFGILLKRGDGWVAPLIVGGGQEFDLRSGTQDPSAATSAARALEMAQSEIKDHNEKAIVMRQAILSQLDEVKDEVIFCADGLETVPGILSMIVPGANSEELLFLLDEAGLCASAGSACASGALEPSHVLVSMGYTKAQARSSLRLSFTGDEGEETAIAAGRIVVDVIKRLVKA